MNKNLLIVLVIPLVFGSYSCNKRKQIVKTDHIEVCKHYNCADATILQVTDENFPSNWEDHQNDSRKYCAAWAEFLAFKYNILIHVFERNIKGKEFKNFLKTGRGGASIYYPSCLKTFRIGKLNSIMSDIENVYGREPTTLSYGCGKTHYRDELPEFILGGRNSSYTPYYSEQDAVTWYGEDCGFSGRMDFSDIKNIRSRPSGGRFYTDIQVNNVDINDGSNFVIEQVQKTVKNSGFYTNFMHWQDYYKTEDGALIEGVHVIPILYEAISAGIGDASNAKVDYNEAIEYLYIKEAVDSVKLVTYYDNNPELLVYIRKARSIDYNIIKTPITLNFNKKQFNDFDYKRIVLSDQIVSVSQDDDHFYIKAILDFNASEQYIEIELDSPRLISHQFQKPDLKIINSESVQATIPSKFILFRKRIHAKDYELEVVDRSYDYSKEYKLENIDSNYQYFVGAINKNRESTVIEL
jgi:hypothetical protein